ncbi:MAG: FAD-dependent oxidoreductase [Anaerolineales bacterium]|nr:NAD(P)/FAD-dependent oxidoreductase [Anaerolineae bacterium]PWB54655.1 MAG: FAD-dependent oxidoreductase [Anaerolineales bacterium]
MTVLNRPQVVIIGAGFGGLWAAKTLACSGVDVWLVDRNNYHTFSPLLYQVATAELEPDDIIYPVRSIFHKYPNVHFVLGEVTSIDALQRVVNTQQRRIGYDYLLFSLGSAVNYYGIHGAAEHTFPLKDMDDAVRLRNHILCKFEAANYEVDKEIRRQILTFTIVGGGPTGVEYCGALAELVRKPMERDYPSLDMSQVHIILLEATGSLLTGLPKRLHQYTLDRLTRMGVEVRLNSHVQQITSTAVTLNDGQIIPTETVVWTAGVQGAGLKQQWKFPTLPNGQVNLLPTLQVPDYPEIYVVGDLAHVKEDRRNLPMVAPVATQEGTWAAQNILRQVKGSLPLPFRYKDQGTMAVVGRNAAAVRLGSVTFTGFLAWIIWALIHLYRLIGFRNRLLVFLNWSMDYLLYERVVRLITPLPENDAIKNGCLE